MKTPLRRAAPLLAAILLAAPLGLASPQENAGHAACPRGFTTMEDVGTVCPRENGLYEVYASDGSSLGFIHGSDPVPPGPDVVADADLAAAAPNCVSGAPGTYYVQVIYARASDRADRYATSVDMIRHMTNTANQLVDNAAVATGSTASINVKCVDGEVEVRNEALPTPGAAASFSTITRDLRDRGYNDGRVKYWIYYDDTSACTCGGQGNVYGDDRLTSSNYNNGNAAPMYAITYGYNSTRIWLHELGHNLGAVQLSAPHTSGGYHCNDGRDTMCYADGGSNSSYTTGRCAVEVWDCGKDSYFNANPPSSSYLATHWNIGSALNRFIRFGQPSLTSLSCAPTSVELGNATTCTFVGHDDSGSVRYRIDWGDGTIEHVPSTSTFAPGGEPQSRSHTYASTGVWTVSVGISDPSGTLGNTRAATIDVRDDFVPPVVSYTEPFARTIYNGCDWKATSPFGIPRPVWVDRACVKASAHDARTSVTRVEIVVGGTLVATLTAPPYEAEFPVPRTQLNVPVFVYAFDEAGNRGYVVFNVDMVATP